MIAGLFEINTDLNVILPVFHSANNIPSGLGLKILTRKSPLAFVVDFKLYTKPSSFNFSSNNRANCFFPNLEYLPKLFPNSIVSAHFRNKLIKFITLKKFYFLEYIPLVVPIFHQNYYSLTTYIQIKTHKITCNICFEKKFEFYVICGIQR